MKGQYTNQKWIWSQLQAETSDKKAEMDSKAGTAQLESEMTVYVYAEGHIEGNLRSIEA